MLATMTVPSFDKLFDSMFQRSALPLFATNGFSAYSPAVDVREDESAFHFAFDVPGMKAEDLDVSLENGVLTLKGKREAVEKGENLYTSRRYGSFTRSFSLPKGVNTEEASAKLADGVLTVRIGKRPEVTPRRIEIQVSGEAEKLPESDA